MKSQGKNNFSKKNKKKDENGEDYGSLPGRVKSQSHEMFQESWVLSILFKINQDASGHSARRSF